MHLYYCSKNVGMDHPTLLCRCPMQQQILFTRSRKQNKYKMINLNYFREATKEPTGHQCWPPVTSVHEYLKKYFATKTHAT